MNNVLILGGKGMLGAQIAKVFGERAIAWDRHDCDVTDTKDLKIKLSIISYKLSAIINCTSYNDVDGAESNAEAAFKMNAEVPGELAKICKEFNLPLVHFSTNYVFDGIKGEYLEADQTHPLSVYAQSKAKGELEIEKNHGSFYVIRTSVLFGPKGESDFSKKSFIDIMLEKIATSDIVQVVNDEVNSLTYAVDLAQAVMVLLEQKFPFGIYHLVNSGEASWEDFAKEIFILSNKNVHLVPVPGSQFARAAKRPKKSVLLNTKFPSLRPWQEALKEFLSN